MKYIYLLIFLFKVISSIGQTNEIFYEEVQIKEKQADTLNFKIERMLILGMGGSLERIFLNEVSDKLIKEFSSKKIVATYEYIGKSPEEAKKNYKAGNRSNYDAILFFNPTDTNGFDISYISSNGHPFERMALIHPNRRGDRYKQTFDIQLYKRTDINELKIWWVSVDIDSEPGSKRAPKKLARTILEQFSIHHYIE